MNRRERITLGTILILLCAVVLAGFPFGRGDAGFVSVHADSATQTPAPKATATPVPTGKVTPTPTGKVTQTPTPTPTPELVIPHVFTSVSAYYTGPAVVVGDELDYKSLQVYAMFEDGSSEPVSKDDYILSETRVLTQGSNRFVVIYKGSTQTFYVQGKVLERIVAQNNKSFYGLYNSLDPEEVTLTAYYNDSSMELVEAGAYSVTPAAFTVTGPQTVTLTYREQDVSFDVYVNEAKPIKSLSVDYLGDALIQEQVISRDDIKVMCVYDDGFYTAEKVNSYEIQQESFTSVGDNLLVVTFRGMTATCKIPVKAKQVKSISAKYTGEPVEIGRVYSEDDLHVYLKYNDDTEVETKEYNVYDSVIRYLGDNTIRIYYGDYTTSVKIEGIEELPTDFSYVSEFSIRSGENRFTITTALPKRMDPEAIDGKLVKKTKLTKAFRRLKSENGWYCGFNYDFAEFKDEANLPVTIRLTLPEDMEPEFTELYYTPDLKNILATMNKEQIDEHTLEITIFKTGTYMIVYDPEAYFGEEEEDEDDEEE